MMVVHGRRRPMLLAAALSLVTITFFYFSFNPSLDPPIFPLQSPHLRVAIVESAGWHDEVLAALVHAFGSQPNVDLSAYHKPRFGIQTLLTGLPLAKLNQNKILSEPKKFYGHPHANTTHAFDVAVLTTCDMDLTQLEKTNTLKTLFNNTNTKLLCIIHHADKLNKYIKLTREWEEAGRIEFVMLSEHTASFFRKLWPHPDPTVRIFPPVFPLPYSPPPTEDPAKFKFGMQGNFQSSRRDYKSVFRALSQMAVEERPTLHLIGHGSHPKVPGELRELVKFHENQDYTHFYGSIRALDVVLPAFANNDYLDRKASSTIPAALIAGTPLVCSEKLLKAYTYLAPEACEMRGEGEREMKVLESILRSDEEKKQTWRREKRAMVENVARSVWEQNIKMVGKWVEDELKKRKSYRELMNTNELTG